MDNQRTAYFTCYLDYFQILTTRSVQDDTDYVSFTLQAKKQAKSTNPGPITAWHEPQTLTQFMGNMTNGACPTGLDQRNSRLSLQTAGMRGKAHPSVRGIEAGAQSGECRPRMEEP